MAKQQTTERRTKIIDEHLWTVTLGKPCDLSVLFRKTGEGQKMLESAPEWKDFGDSDLDPAYICSEDRLGEFINPQACNKRSIVYHS